MNGKLGLNSIAVKEAASMWIGLNWLRIVLGITNTKFWSSVTRDHFLSHPYLPKFSSLCFETESVRTVHYTVVDYNQVVWCSSFKTYKKIKIFERLATEFKLI